MGTDEQQNQEFSGTPDNESGITRVESLDDEDYISPLTSDEISSFMAEMRKKYSALVVDRLEETAEHDEETGGRNIVVIDGIEREVQLRDLLYHAVEEVITVEPRHNLVKLEASKDGTYLRVEACHVVGEVHGDVLRVVEQGNERVARRVVKLQFSCRLPQ